MTGVVLLLPPRRRACEGRAWRCPTRRAAWPSWAAEVLAPYHPARAVSRRAPTEETTT